MLEGKKKVTVIARNNIDGTVEPQKVIYKEETVIITKLLLTIYVPCTAPLADCIYFCDTEKGRFHLFRFAGLWYVAENGV